jgi:acrylyl-CoA reductase (NADPH)
MDFPATVAPFILRGVTLLGINSVYRPLADRIAAWQRLAQEIDFTKLDTMTRTIRLTQSIDGARELLDGKVRGRLVVSVAGRA